MSNRERQNRKHEAGDILMENLLKFRALVEYKLKIKNVAAYKFSNFTRVLLEVKASSC